MNTLWNNIPEEMKALPNWIYWKLEERNGKQTKIPYNCRTGSRASSTDASTWSDFERACRVSVNGNGIGFVFTNECGFVGLDMDGSYDMDLINWFGSYAERSQSGTGAHVIMKGALPQRFNDTVEGVGRRVDKYELYQTGRYFVMTGAVLLNKPITACQEKLDQFLLEVFPAPTQFDGKVDISKICGTSIASEHTILERIRNSAQADKFNALWSGDTSAYDNDQSRADAALLGIIHFWARGNKAESFDLFRQSGLMRKKSERPDYLERTWKKVEGGEIYEAVEPVPAQFIQTRNAEIAPWRRITIDHVLEAIKGTILEPMTWALCSPADPVLPLEIGLAKALALCGCALSGKRESQRRLGDLISKGKKLSRVQILSGGGMTPNFWTLLVGKSSNGKDIGDMLENAAMQFKWLIGTAGSEEGIADSYMNNGIGLLSISEMMNWLDARHWQSKAAGFLTHAFNKGWFSHAMSKRGQDSTNRETDYCFPNICAAVQPGVLATYANKTHIESGFLGRFLVFKMPSFTVYPVVGDTGDQLRILINCLKILNTKEGIVTPPPKYNWELNQVFENNNAEPESSWKRLTAEYYPRLALILSIPDDDESTDVQITDEGWKRAAVLVQYLFAQAEAAFGSIEFDIQQGKFEALCARVLDIVKTAPDGKCLKWMVSKNTGRGTKSKDREEAIKELVSRGNLVEEQITTDGRKSTILRIQG